MQESANPLIKSLFSGKNSNASTKGKLNFISVGSKFKTQLAELMEKLEQNVRQKSENVLFIEEMYKKNTYPNGSFEIVIIGNQFHSLHQTKQSYA